MTKNTPTAYKKDDYVEAVKFENVYFSYETEEPSDEAVFAAENAYALNGVDFSVEEGEFVAVLGRNGSGKSTLARLINGLLTPSSGKITVLGMDACNEDNLFDIRKQVGIVFQNPDNQMVASIVEDDIAFGPENIGVSRQEIGERIAFALDAVGMQQFRTSTPSRLSGGQKQRIAIAGVLALKPRVMILDESTAMLDPRGRKEVMDVVLRLNKQEHITVILITHFAEEAMLADRAVVMNGGKVVLQGTPQEVLKRAEELEKYSLTLPKPLKICRGLTAGGLPVEDGMTAEEVTTNIVTALQGKTLRNAQEDTATVCQPTEGEIGRVVCQNLYHIYNEKTAFETYALSGVDLEIYPRDFFGIIGHTGSGKSTFVQHLNALIKLPTAEKKYKPKKLKKGETPPPQMVLRVNGYDLADKNTDFKALRGKVGMVFQYPEYQLFAETVKEDVAFGLRNFKTSLSEAEVEAAVKEAIETVGLCYEEVKNRSPFELSGGQKRRVAVAGVIVSKPEILVLDEPAAGLDPLGKEDIMGLLHKIHQDWCKTIIIVSHDMDEIAENCNRVAIFSEGKLLELDTPKNLFKKTEQIEKVGLDIPFTAKVVEGLKQHGVEVDCDFTMKDFLRKTLDLIETTGAGMRSSVERGQENA